MTGSHRPQLAAVLPDEVPARRRLPDIPTWVWVMAAALLFLLLAGAATAAAVHSTAKDKASSALATRSNQLAGGVGQLCATPGAVADALRSAGQCQQASAVQSAAVAVTAVPTNVTTEVTRPPTAAELDAAVSRYCAGHNGCTSAADVVAAVGQVLATHPPVTADAIAAAASTYLATHAADFQGKPGADASDDQVSAKVAVYCAAHADCVGPSGLAGSQGAQGVGVTDVRFVGDPSNCQVVVSLHDPVDGTDTAVSHPVPGALCPVLVTETTTP